MTQPYTKIIESVNQRSSRVQSNGILQGFLPLIVGDGVPLPPLGIPRPPLHDRRRTQAVTPTPTFFPGVPSRPRRGCRGTCNGTGDRSGRDLPPPELVRKLEVGRGTGTGAAATGPSTRPPMSLYIVVR